MSETYVFTMWIEDNKKEIEYWHNRFCNEFVCIPLLDFATFLFRNTLVRYISTNIPPTFYKPSLGYERISVDESQVADFLIEMKLGSNFLSLLEFYEYPGNVPPIVIENESSEEEEEAVYSSYCSKKIIV